MELLGVLCVPLTSIVLFICYLIILEIVRKFFFENSSKAKSEKISILIILGSGGHTSEMLRLVSALDTSKYFPRTYMLAETDTSSMCKLKTFNLEGQVEVIPRSREVGQSWISTIFTTLKATLASAKVLWKYRPKLLLCNGPGTCVPPCLIAWIYNLLSLQRTKIVFVESICRIKTVSLSGKILCHIADVCLVQWPELAAKDNRFTYIARFT